MKIGPGGGTRKPGPGANDFCKTLPNAEQVEFVGLRDFMPNLARALRQRSFPRNPRRLTGGQFGPEASSPLVIRA